MVSRADTLTESIDTVAEMRHLLHHEEGDVGVAYCGYRKQIAELGPTELNDCVVCWDVWQAELRERS